MKIHNYVVHGLFFNEILSISMEAYFEFYISGMMNVYTAEI